MKPDLQHIKEKVSECISELEEATPGNLQHQHALFQLSYNVGRLSELTGEGRAVYDAVRPHIDNADWEFVQEAVDVFIDKHQNSSRVAVVSRYEEAGGSAYFSTQLNLTTIPELGVTDDHVVLDSIREIGQEWSAIAHK